jgi:GNAT superfamily N-acetyltransferase
MPVSVRVAVAPDAPTLAALNQHVHGLHVAARPEFFLEPAAGELTSWFASRVEGPSSRVWIAEEDGASVGYVLVFFHERPMRPFTHARRWCEIDQIAVAPEGRRRGAARALIEAALDEARRRGIRDIELSSWAFNTSAHEVFRRLGFTPKVIRFERILQGGA